MQRFKPSGQYGPPDLYSPGLMSVMADRQIYAAFHEDTADTEITGDKSTFVRMHDSGKWFTIPSVSKDNVYTAMLGAIMGDVMGSVYERFNIKYKLTPDKMIDLHARFTDDTVMTCAVADGIRYALDQLPTKWMGDENAELFLLGSVKDSIYRYGHNYPGAGYGSGFKRWLWSEDPQPYNSWGNGSAMRASYAGWIAQSLEEAEKLAEISACVTHNHPKGIKGAQVVAGSIFLLRSGASKVSIKQYASRFYDMDFTLDEIRDEYFFDASCEGTVPFAIMAFLEGNSFLDVISCAISIGGDSDTIAAISGSLAEVIYPIPHDVREEVLDRVDAPLLRTIAEAVDFCYKRNKRE